MSKNKFEEVSLQWNHNDSGFDGVRSEGDNLIWYTHSFNPFAGGGAMDQPIKEFLVKGPPLAVPHDIVVKIKAILVGNEIEKPIKIPDHEWSWKYNTNSDHGKIFCSLKNNEFDWHGESFHALWKGYFNIGKQSIKDFLKNGPKKPVPKKFQKKIKEYLEDYEIMIEKLPENIVVESKKNDELLRLDQISSKKIIVTPPIPLSEIIKDNKDIFEKLKVLILQKIKEGYVLQNGNQEGHSDFFYREGKFQRADENVFSGFYSKVYDDGDGFIIDVLGEYGVPGNHSFEERMKCILADLKSPSS